MEENIRKCVDFNCDISTIDLNDKEFDILDYVSSVNIPCGVHEGSPLEIKNIIEHCKFKNKVIGASIGFEQATSKKSKAIDAKSLSDDEIEAIVLYQLGAMDAFARANSLVIEYVRPTGIMYQEAAKNYDFSISLAKAIKKYGKWLLYYGAACENLINASNEVGINYASEVCLDLSYGTGGLPEFEQETKLDSGISLIRLRRLSNLSELELSDGSYKKFDYDTIHFSSKYENIKELLVESHKIVDPHPVNYNKAVPSGWV